MARPDLTATTVSDITDSHCHAFASANKILNVCVFVCVFTESLLVVVIVSSVLGACIIILVAVLVAKSIR